MIGSTKVAEYLRTIDMLVDMVHCTKEELMYLLYFLYDSSYEGKDLKAIANLIEEGMRK